MVVTRPAGALRVPMALSEIAVSLIQGQAAGATTVRLALSVAQQITIKVERIVCRARRDNTKTDAELEPRALHVQTNLQILVQRHIREQGAERTTVRSVL